MTVPSKGNDLPFESHNVYLFEMIYDCLFESVAVSIGEENRNGDEKTVEVAERQGIFRAYKKKTEEMTRKICFCANGIAMPCRCLFEMIMIFSSK